MTDDQINARSEALQRYAASRNAISTAQVPEQPTAAPVTQGRVIDAIRGIGRLVTRVEGSRHLRNPDQIKALFQRNPMTPAVWAYRLIKRGALLAEVSYGTFLDQPLIGVTVFRTDPELAHQDHDLSQSFHSVEAMADYLRELDLNGGAL